MWRKIAIFLGAVSALAAQPIREIALDPKQVVDLPISREVTAITFPGPITAVAGADMLIDDGRNGADVDQTANLRFHVSHATGSNFLLVQSLDAGASGTLDIIFDGAAYVLALRTVAANPVASVIFDHGTTATAVRVNHVPEPVKFSPRIGFSLLDRARAYPVLAKELPRAIEGVTRRVENRKVELPDLEITIQEVLRFSKEDAVVFLLDLRNKTTHPIDIAPNTFAARVANEKFNQSIANGPRTLAPGTSGEAEFAIVGTPGDTRNDLSADNAFTILVNTAPHEATASAAPSSANKRTPSS